VIRFEFVGGEKSGNVDDMAVASDEELVAKDVVIPKSRGEKSM
jgi:hypothetical protein